MLINNFIFVEIYIWLIHSKWAIALFILQNLYLSGGWNIYLLNCLLMFTDSLPSCLKFFNHFFFASLSINCLWNYTKLVWVTQRLQGYCLFINTFCLITILFKLLRHEGIPNRLQTCCLMIKNWWLRFDYYHLIIHGKFRYARSCQTGTKISCLCLLGLRIICRIPFIIFKILLILIFWIVHE